MKLYMSYYIYKGIPHANFEADSCFSFGDMTSQNFPRNKGMSHQIRLFTPRKTGLTFKKWVFMSRIVLLDPKLTPMSISVIFKRGKNFSLSKFLGRLERDAAATPLIDQFCYNLAKRCLKDKN